MSNKKNYKQFLVVEDEKRAVCTIPLKWVKTGGGRFSWPSSSNVKDLARNQVDPKKHWSTFKIRKIYYDVDTFDEGLAKEYSAVNDSTVESDYAELMGRTISNGNNNTFRNVSKKQDVNKVEVPSSLSLRNSIKPTIGKNKRQHPLPTTSSPQKRQMHSRVNSPINYTATYSSDEETQQPWLKSYSDINEPQLPTHSYYKDRTTLPLSTSHRDLTVETSTPKTFRASSVTCQTCSHSNKEILDKINHLSDKMDRRDDILLKELQYLRRCVAEITKKRNKTEADEMCISLERQLQLPIGNSYLLTCNDSKLLRDKDHRAKFIDCIRRYATPVQNTNERLKIIYDNVFSKSIAAEFNWAGQFGKLPFRDSETVQTINEYFRSTITGNEAVDIQKLIRKWLKNKSDLASRYKPRSANVEWQQLPEQKENDEEDEEGGETGNERVVEEAENEVEEVGNEEPEEEPREENENGSPEKEKILSFKEF